MDRIEVRAALEQGTYRERVIHDDGRARALGTTAGPTMMVNRTDESLKDAESLSGAQPYEIVKAAVERANT